jgi:hypothetical protein
MKPTHGGRVVVAVFLAMIASMTTGGIWAGFARKGVDGVLAITFAVTFTVALVVQYVRKPTP